MKKIFHAVLLLGFLVNAPSFAQPQHPLGSSKKGETALARKMNDYLTVAEMYGFSGSILLEQDRRTTLDKGYGWADKAKGIGFSDSVIIPVASISKTFVATAILQLAGEGKLSVDDKLPRWFANVPDDKKDITIRHLLSHSSGMAQSSFVVASASEDEFITKILGTPLPVKTGIWSYSTTAFTLLAVIVEKASGMPYREYVRTNIFRPLGMTSTGFIGERFAPEASYSHSYNRDLEFTGSYALPFPLDLTGGADVVSTMLDLSKWLDAVEQHRVLSAALTDQQHTSATTVNATTSVGFGWFVERAKDGSIRIGTEET